MQHCTALPLSFVLRAGHDATHLCCQHGCDYSWPDSSGDSDRGMSLQAQACHRIWICDRATLWTHVAHVPDDCSVGHVSLCACAAPRYPHMQKKTLRIHSRSSELEDSTIVCSLCEPAGLAVIGALHHVPCSTAAAVIHVGQQLVYGGGTYILMVAVWMFVANNASTTQQIFKVDASPSHQNTSRSKAFCSVLSAACS